ncbi:MAG: response regulator transcription factor [Planctomycetes bacterium]|nr:response regulator transcription factor [Planctomycetota bacterium]MCB9891555.1 response regulator transcription factor [Planctomycetota bacterium]
MHEQLAEILDALNEGAVCVDAQGVVLHRNSKAPATVLRDAQSPTTPPRLSEELQAEVASIRDGVARLDLRFSQDRINCVVRRLSGGRAGQRSSAVVLFPDAEAGDRLGQIRARYQLTPREGDVLACVIRGRRNADIAKDLQLSEYTVKGHLKRIFQKLGVRSRTHAVAKVMEHGDLGARETV